MLTNVSTCALFGDCFSHCTKKFKLQTIDAPTSQTSHKEQHATYHGVDANWKAAGCGDAVQKTAKSSRRTHAPCRLCRTSYAHGVILIGIWKTADEDMHNNLRWHPVEYGKESTWEPYPVGQASMHKVFEINHKVFCLNQETEDCYSL